MRGYLLRIIFDSEVEDVYKDILFNAEDIFENVQNVLVQRFGIESGQKTGFWLADDAWEKHEEFDIQKHRLCDAVFRKGDRLIFESGEFNTWRFLIELLSVHELLTETILPYVSEEYGLLPDQPDLEEYDPDTYLLNNSRTAYKEKEQEKEEDSDDDDPENEKDIWEYF